MNNNTNTDRLTRLDAAASSRALKAELRKAFPGVKFSVRMSRGTGYGNAHVSWDGGAPRSGVEAITRKYQGRGFDGMTDSTTFHRTEIVVKGERYESGLGLILVNAPRDCWDA